MAALFPLPEIFLNNMREMLGDEYPAFLRALEEPAALALRLLLRKAPKWLRCLLWLPVALRLLCPVLPEAGVSLMPRAER